MQFQIKLLSRSCPLRLRNALCPFLLVLVGLVLCAGKSHAQQNGYTHSKFSNVEVRHEPSAAVWSGTGTTRAVGGTGRIPPTIVHGENGVKAVLNPSWFVKDKRHDSPSSKGAKTYLHTKHPSPQTRAISTKKAVHAVR